MQNQVENKNQFSRQITTIFGIGKFRPAPGTWGSAVALPMLYVVHLIGSFPAVTLATGVMFAIGWWATVEQTNNREDHDPSEIVIDEVTGQWLALWPVSASSWHLGIDLIRLWPGWVAAFLLFRLFDIWKPGPVSWADQRFDALGVMLDDVIAGLLAAATVVLLAVGFHGLQF